jgi:tetratricopeptide (TPR) repeat protein
VADGRRGEVLCHEENPDRQVNLRFEAGKKALPDLPPSTFRYANIYLDPELGATERDLYGSYWRANRGRFERLGEHLRAREGSLDPDGMASILGDPGDGRCRLREAIAMLLTVGSVVMRPEDCALWVATGSAPVSQNRYEPFSLSSEDHAPELGTLAGGIPQDARAALAFAAYRDAYLAWFDSGDRHDARGHLARATELAPEEPLYHAAAGLCAIACGDAEETVRSFDRAIALGHPDPERVAGFKLWRARAHDLALRGDQALVDYRAALESSRIDRPVAKAAADGTKRPFTARRARRVEVEFAYADVVMP